MCRYLTLLLVMHLTLVLRRVSAAPPSGLPSNWLEEFLARDWKAASEFIHSLADNQPHNPLAEPASPPTPSALFDDEQLFERPASSSEEPPPPSLPSHEAIAQVGPPERVQQPSNIHAPSPGVPMLGQSSRQVVLPPQAEPRIEVFSHESPGAPENDLTNSQVRITHQQIEALQRAQAMLPNHMPLPTYYSWSPSTQLVQEMRHFLEAQQPGSTARDLTSPNNMLELPFDQGANSGFFFSSEFFRANQRVILLQLPSNAVLIKFFMRKRLVPDNPLGKTMTIWTLEQRDGLPVLDLRAIWGIRDLVERHIKKTFVQSPINAIQYVVRSRYRQGYQHPYLAQVLPPHSIEVPHPTSSHEATT